MTLVTRRVLILRSDSICLKSASRSSLERGILSAKREEGVGLTRLLGITAIMRPFGLSLMSLIGTYLSMADLGTLGGNVMR